MNSNDPIEFSIFLSRMRNVVDEMSVTLSRAAMTPIIALAHDFSCCIYDVQARQVAVHDALPIQTSSMDLLIEETAAAFKGDIAPGDVMLCNDLYRGNTHVGDLVVLAPVFVDGRHLFWSCARPPARHRRAAADDDDAVGGERLAGGPRRPAAEDLRRRADAATTCSTSTCATCAGAICSRAT